MTRLLLALLLCAACGDSDELDGSDYVDVARGSAEPPSRDAGADASPSEMSKHPWSGPAPGRSVVRTGS